MKRKNYFHTVFVLTIVSLGFYACSSSDKTELKSAEGIYNKAMALFNDKEYLEAKTTFDLIRLQYPASQFADDAQYYIAECHFKREEYVLSAWNYNMLRRLHPNSNYYKESLFKVCLSYYNLAPQYDLDPDYTIKTIKSMSEFQATYSTDSLALTMDTYIQELRDRLAEREYRTAELYRKLNSPASALIYFDIVINEYDDTKFFEPAYFGKIEVLVEMKKWEQAKTTIGYYCILFQGGENLKKVKDLEAMIPKDI
ncbi:MAG: outer membrane protein assembly factor BamD [bacterium]